MLHDEEDPSAIGRIEQEQLLAQVAWYYYVDGLTQGDIAGRLGLSRIKVSRLLDRGRQSGLIQLTINSPYEGSFQLQQRLCRRFALRDARVVPPLPELSPGERIAQAGRQMLGRKLAERDLLAVGWGAAVTATLRLLVPTIAAREVSIVGLTGGVQAYMDGVGFQRERSRVYLVPAPLRVATPALRQALRAEPQVAEVFELARAARIAIVGIGAVDPDASIVQKGYCSATELACYARRGAVGDLLGCFYDRDGRLLDLELHQQLVSLPLEDLRRIPEVVGIAAGPRKVAAILGALRGRWIDVLITDQPTAEAVLEGAEP